MYHGEMRSSKLLRRGEASARSTCGVDDQVREKKPTEYVPCKVGSLDASDKALNGLDKRTEAVWRLAEKC